LADQHTGGQEYGFERQDRRKQRERIFVKGVMRKDVIENDPGEYEYALKDDKPDSADEPANPVKQAVMYRQLRFILLFKAQDRVNVLGLSARVPTAGCISSRPCPLPALPTSAFY